MELSATLMQCSGKGFGPEPPQACDLLIQSTRAGTTWKLLSNFLQRSGWKKRQRLLAWHCCEMQTEQCVHTETTIRFSRGSLQACLRAIRHSWRRMRFLSWLNRSRHEVALLLENHTREDLLCNFHQVDWSLIRGALSRGPNFRSILLGSFVSDVVCHLHGLWSLGCVLALQRTPWHFFSLVLAV